MHNTQLNNVGHGGLCKSAKVQGPITMEERENMNKYRNLMARMGGALLLAGAFVAMSPARADAALMVWICNDAACAGEVAVTDNMAGDLNPAAGAITVITAAGSVELATSYPFIGSPAEPVLNVTYNLGSADFAALVDPWIYASQDAFTGQGSLYFEADASNGSGVATAYAGAGAFAPPGNAGDIVGGPCIMDCNDTGVAPAAPYYLAIGLNITPGAGGGASGDATITVVPEPASMALFGLGLFGVGVMSRRRKARR